MYKNKRTSQLASSLEDLTLYTETGDIIEIINDSKGNLSITLTTAHVEIDENNNKILSITKNTK